MDAKEIAQWVIDNRYPKMIKVKVSDLELYNYLVEKINAYANQSNPDVSEIIGIIESAKCPNSRCVDGVIDEIPDGEISQCQWCYEAEKILIKLQSKPDVSVFTGLLFGDWLINKGKEFEMWIVSNNHEITGNNTDELWSMFIQSKPDVSDDEATVCDNSCPHWGYQCNINEKFKECTKSRKSKLTPK